MSEKDLKLTDLDYATGDHHLQMMKAALPYLDIRRQRSLSMFIRARGDDAHHGIFPGER